MDDGYRLDLIFNLHNVESGETPHLACAQFEPKEARYDACRTLHKRFIRPMFKEHGFNVSDNPWGTGYSRRRLSGFLHHYYGALVLPYEVNSQAPRRHLSLYELKTLGAHLVRAAAKYLYSDAARRLVADINHRRGFRLHAAEHWGYETSEFDSLSPFESEKTIRLGPNWDLQDQLRAKARLKRKGSQ